MIISAINNYRPLTRNVNTLSSEYEGGSSISFASSGKSFIPQASGSWGNFKRLLISGLLCLSGGCSSGKSDSTVASKLLDIWNAAGIKASKIPDRISYRTKIGTKEYELNKIRTGALNADGSFNPNDVKYEVTPTNTATGMNSREYIDNYSDVPETDALIQGTNLEDVQIEVRDGRLYSTDPATGAVQEILEKDLNQDGLYHVLDPNGNVKNDITGLEFDGNKV